MRERRRNKNIGIGDIEKMNLKGIPLIEAENIFSKAVYGHISSVDSK